MAKIWKEINSNIQLIDKALMEKNSVAAWTELTLDHLLNQRVMSGLRVEEAKLISDTFASSPAEAYALLGKKMHVAVEGDTAFYDACKKANVPSLPRESRAEISSKAIKNFLNNYVKGAVNNGKLQSEDNTPLNDLAISILATAQYHAELAEKTAPFYTKLESYQKQVEKVEKQNNKIKGEDKRTPLEKNLSSLGVNFGEYKNAVKNVHLITPENPENANLGGSAKDIPLQNLANSGLRNATLSVRQADSALVSNAVWERLIYEPSQWRFTMNKLNNKETLDFLCKDGENRDELLARINTYSQEILSILPDKSVINSQNSRDYASLVGTLINGCIKEGVFGYDSAEERFSALAKVTCDEKISKILDNHPEFLPQGYKDLSPDGINQVFLFDHENQIVPVMPNWWPANNPPKWLVEGNKIPEEGRDVIDQIDARVTTDYASLPDEQKIIVPDNVSYVDLTNKDVKIGNTLTYLAFQKHHQEKTERIEKEKAEKQASLPNLASDEGFFGLCSDLSYYAQCMQEAARNFAKYGIYFKTSTDQTTPTDGTPAEETPVEPATPEAAPEVPTAPETSPSTETGTETMSEEEKEEMLRKMEESSDEESAQ